MSPSEFDLRAALRDGEGDGVNVERVIAGAQAQRARHRTWLLSAAAAVVVAGVGTGSAVVWGGGSGAGPHAESAASGASHGSIPGLAGPAHTTTRGSVAAGPEQPAPSPNSAASIAATATCPSTYPHYLLPGGSSPGQFGSDGPLFSKPVVALVVCGYGTPQEAANLKPPARPGRLVFTGSQATQLAASLENASKTPGTESCAGTPNELAMVGVSADGTTGGTITTTVTDTGCDVQITNGTAVRYNWQPPSKIAPVIANLTPLKDTPLHPTTPGMHGSPPR